MGFGANLRASLSLYRWWLQGMSVGHVNHVARVSSHFGGRVVHIGWSCRLCWSWLVICLASRKKYA